MRYLLLILLFPLAAFAQATQPATQPTTSGGGYEIHDWLVLIVDASTPTLPANADATFNNTLPPFIASFRRANPATNPTASANPVGVITFHGSPQENIELTLAPPAGRVVAHWPSATRALPLRYTWNLKLLEQGAPSQGVSDGHWFATLGKSGGLTVAGAANEKLVLYDAQIPVPSPLKVESRDGKPFVAEGAALRNLTFYAPAEGKWIAARPSQGPATQPEAWLEHPRVKEYHARLAAAEREMKEHVQKFNRTPEHPQVRQLQAKLDELQRSLRQEKEAFNAPAGTLNFSVAQPAEAAALMSYWRERLSTQGFTVGEIDALLAALQAHALDPAQMTALYRLDASDLDKLVAVTANPAPARHVRAGVVIVRGIDPTFTDRVEKLIAQLGDPDWKTRETASEALGRLGRLAKLKLEAALRNKDVEVVFRAEQLLAKLNPMPEANRR